MDTDGRLCVLYGNVPNESRRMYRVEGVGLDGPVTSLHFTATDAMLAVQDLREAGLGEVRLTDASGCTLSELQLAMLTLMERQLATFKQAR